MAQQVPHKRLRQRHDDGDDVVVQDSQEQDLPSQTPKKRRISEANNINNNNAVSNDNADQYLY